MKYVNCVSSCCHSGVSQGIHLEYPLGGVSHSIAYKIDVCEECGQPVEYLVEQCEVCGEVGCSGECDEDEETNEISINACW